MEERIRVNKLYECGTDKKKHELEFHVKKWFLPIVYI